MTKETKLILFVFCFIKLMLHFIVDTHSGFQGDELLHIETGKHLAFGYMEFPPLIGILAFIQNLLGSTSVYAHHLFSHISSILIIIYVAKTTLELGGKNKAVFITLLCIIIAPAFGRTQQLFQPVVFSQLFWVLSFYQLVRYTKYLDKKYLLYLTIFVVLGISVKYDILFFIAGLSSLLFFKRTRQSLLCHKIGLHIIVALLLILPNIYWQFINDFPLLQMFNRLYETQLDKISRVSNVNQVLLAINPLNLIVFFPALFYMFSVRKKEIFRPLAFAISMSFLFLFISNGKAYYYFSLVLTILPFGGLYWEQVFLQKRKWLQYPIVSILLFGSVLIPFGMPVFTFNHMLNTIQKYENKEIEGGKYAVKYDEYYTNEKWKRTLTKLKKVYDSLPEDEKKDCLIWGKHYGQAGIVNLLGEDYGLPKAFSYHGSFYTWAPKGDMPKTTITLSYQVGGFFDPYFEEITVVDTIYNPYAKTEEELYQKIAICRKPRQSYDEMKPLFKNRIFE